MIAAFGACQTTARPGILRIVDGRPMLTPLASEEAYAHFLRGELQLNRGEVEAALQQFKRALAADPASPYIRTRLAAALAVRGRFVEALAHAEDALRRRPGFAEALLVAAAVHLRQGRTRRAEEALRECVELNPRLAAAYIKLAALLEEQGLRDARRGAEARRVLEQLTRALPDEPAGHARLALRCLRELDYGCAAAAARRLAELEPTVPALLQLAHAHRGLGQLDAAVRALREAFDRSGGHAAVAFPLAEALAEGGAGPAVDDLVDLLARQAHGEPRQLAAAAEIALRGKRPARALAVIEGHARFADRPELALRRALALEELGRRDEAKQLLAGLAAVRGNPVAPVAAAQLAAILQRAGDGVAAARTLRAARALHGHHEGLVIGLARVLQRQGLQAAAVDVLQRAVAEAGGPALELGLALALEKAGRWREAVTLAERVAAKRPRDAAAHNFVGYCLADRGVELERAVRELRTALFFSPQEAYIIDSLGWALYRSGQRAAAERALAIAARLAPEEPEILAHLAEVRAALRQIPAAIGLLRRALGVSEDPLLSARLRARIERLTRGQVGRRDGKAR